MNSRNNGAQEQDFLLAVALNAMIPLANERTLQAAYYILRGRKANQTLQDVHLYSLYPYYRMFPQLSKENWDKIVSNLLQRKLIVEIEGAGGGRKPTFAVTATGLHFAREQFGMYQMHLWLAPFNQSSLTYNTELFWQRLHLLVQTISQMAAASMNFIPVVSDRRIQQWVKMQVGDSRVRSGWKNHLADELYALWAPFPAQVQRLMVAQLSGAAQTGKTLGQLAMQQGESKFYLHVLFRFGLVSSIQRLHQEKEQFPYLHALVQIHDPENGDPRLSESASRTYALIKRGYQKDKIAKLRGIKVSTVEDHLVEMALRCREWDCSDYLHANQAAEIVSASEKLGTSRLRMIKDHLGKDVSYLQIRLALAQRQGESAP
ncbi:helix-turn-helix domain-containing protein [Brevibacillus sp. AY1]|uniref:helix-turn-helix domain-containing protein n=1 Tax=Brevibacillus sp. AY1 TaxID=2807621 RepID=UPI002456D65F|nr:helix-turn-helix domain-containing protein [Brevibacillus sp. AY1]MDH4615973.1 helix-turn-helix domain-containing protein [Brevibacillus sp. AY1]